MQIEILVGTSRLFSTLIMRLFMCAILQLQTVIQDDYGSAVNLDIDPAFKYNVFRSKFSMKISSKYIHIRVIFWGVQ